jgi:hypothetical protein
VMDKIVRMKSWQFKRSRLRRESSSQHATTYRQAGESRSRAATSRKVAAIILL